VAFFASLLWGKHSLKNSINLPFLGRFFYVDGVAGLALSVPERLGCPKIRSQTPFIVIPEDICWVTLASPA